MFGLCAEFQGGSRAAPVSQFFKACPRPIFFLWSTNNSVLTVIAFILSQSPSQVIHPLAAPRAVLTMA